ncbi:MAG: ROK family protein [Betaproteobacteria bacterium]|nr:ROK family protein [Betaproteobacteria bacterium]
MKIGIDLGGTKTEIAAFDASGKQLLRRREPTPAQDYAATLALIAKLVADAEREVGQRGSVGIGTPGALSPATGLMRNSNSACLNQQRVKDDLERTLGRDIRIANDANCFALSEAVDGAGAGAATVFGVILGTGCGGGIVINGQVIDGPNAAAGEWGHNALPWPEDNERPGPPCYCGKHGCIETFVSGPGLARDYAAWGGAALTAAQIVARVPGDTLAEAALTRYEHRLARALASVINVLDPHVIVLGGGLSNVERLYANVPKLWDRWVFADVVRTVLKRNVHGDSSGVRGAAWLWN